MRNTHSRHVLSSSIMGASALLGLAIVLFINITTANSGISDTPGAGANAHLLSEPKWLLENLNNEHIVIIDVRSEQEYEKAHIRGAINLFIEQTYDRAPRENMIGNISSIQTLFSSKGLDKNKHIVLYDNGEFVHAARVFWVMEVYGHDQVSLLNSGFSAWQQQRYPVSKQTPAITPTHYSPTISPERLATKLSVRLAIAQHHKLIIDARDAQEFQGKTSKSKRFGHIPSAINIPWSLNIHGSKENPTIRPHDELQALYRDIPREQHVITYCNRGRQSALAYFILRYLGYNVSAYDGSWHEWGNDERLPIMPYDEVN